MGRRGRAAASAGVSAVVVTGVVVTGVLAGVAVAGPAGMSVGVGVPERRGQARESVVGVEGGGEGVGRGDPPSGAPHPPTTDRQRRTSSPTRPARPAEPVDAPTPGAKPDGERVPHVARMWPVATRPVVVRGWEPPATPYGPGHRGVDLAAPAGSPVRAVAPGRVRFAGWVAGRGVVSVELAGTGDPALRTTYEPVRAIVKVGDRVMAGQVVGFLETGAFHCPGGCLHWGLRRAAVYLNPLSLLPPTYLHSGPSRLLPVIGVPEPSEAVGRD